MMVDIPQFPLAHVTDVALDWLTRNFAWLTQALSHVTSIAINAIVSGLLFVPPWLLILIVAGIAWQAAGRRVAIFSALGLLFLWNLRLWEPTVQTFTLVLISTLIAVAIGLPLGIAAALSKRTSKVVMPVLDFMQTMPAFVYLIPANPFGSTRRQKLFKVQLPMAVPTIMAGVNQTIMLALSMVVIAAMIGAGGLGGEVWQAIQRLEPGKGFQAGLAIVILAMILDRVTQHIGRGSRKSGKA